MLLLYVSSDSEDAELTAERIALMFTSNINSVLICVSFLALNRKPPKEKLYLRCPHSCFTRMAKRYLYGVYKLFIWPH